MKITFVSRYPWGLFFGGVEVKLNKYLEYLPKIGVECELIDHYSKDINTDIIHCIGLNSESHNILSSARRKGIRAVLQPIYYLNPNTVWRNILINKLSGYRFGGHGLYKLGFDRSELILPNSEAEKKQIIKLFGTPANKFKVIPNGVDDLFFENNEVLDCEDYILHVAMIEQRKNTLNMLRAYNLSGVKKKLLIIGGYRSTNLKWNEEVKKLIDQNPNIEHIGFVSDQMEIAKYFRSAALHLLPSILETPGQTTLQALASGTPCIVGDCPPVREYFSNSVTYVDYRSVEQLAAAIESELKKEKNVEKNRHNAQKFRWSEIATTLKNYHEELLSS